MQILILRANYRSSLSHVRHTYIQFQIQSYHFSYSKMSHMHNHILSILACIQQFIFHMYHNMSFLHIMPKQNPISHVIHFITQFMSSTHISYLKSYGKVISSHIYIHIYCTQHNIGFHSQYIASDSIKSLARFVSLNPTA